MAFVLRRPVVVGGDWHVSVLPTFSSGIDVSLGIDDDGEMGFAGLATSGDAVDL